MKYIIEIPDFDEAVLRNDGMTSRNGDQYIVSGDIKNLEQLYDESAFDRYTYIKSKLNDDINLIDERLDNPGKFYSQCLTASMNLLNSIAYSLTKIADRKD